MDLVTRERFVAAIAFALLPSLALAQSLSLTIGNTVAGQNYALKTAQFVFRINGCEDLSKATVAATAEGIVGTERRSVPLRIVPSQPAGVYAIGQQWGTDGNWTVGITVTCQTETAGAIVPIVGRSFSREGTQLLSHAPTQAEIDAALKASRTQ